MTPVQTELPSPDEFKRLVDLLYRVFRLSDFRLGVDKMRSLQVQAGEAFQSEQPDV